MRLLFCIICAFALCCNCDFACAVEYGSVSSENSIIDYDAINTEKMLEDADLYFNFALNESDEKMRSEYFNMAQQKYSLLAASRYDDIHSVVQLGRICGMQKQNKNAKSYFFRALGIDYQNPDANYYLADLYYENKDYRNALKYYRKALDGGKDEDAQGLYRMAEIFEKFGDLKRANICYKKAFLLNPADENIPDKIREIEALNYNPKGYYDRRNTRQK
ncbi:tetratricopeptide repeat protein [bacterium]|nr:tetratricopeptide repeat protein [bacterium]